MLVTQATRIQTISPELFEAVLPETSREGIRWSGGIGGRPLEVAIDFRNPGPSFSEPASARIDIAPFGAFVPGELLATAAVPSLPPGGVWTFRTAVASGDLPAWAGRGMVAAGNEAGPPRWETPSIAPGLQKRDSPVWNWKTLPSADDAGLMRRLIGLRRRVRRPLIETDGIHFVGNLNVFVSSRQPVERHVARAVKLRAGRANHAMFCIGNGKPAEYVFHPVCESGWHMELEPYGWGTPARITHGAAMLSIVPPPKAESGTASVRVDRIGWWRKSSALVEFELDVRASGSKCYFF